MNSFLILATLNLCLGGLVFLLGLVILRENPGQRLNRVVALMLFFGGAGAILEATTFLVAPTAAAGAAGRPQLLQNVAYLWEFFFPSLFLFACIFPTERAFTHRPRLLEGRSWAPGFGTLVFAPHGFHFVLLLFAAVWKPDLKLHEAGVLRYLEPLTMISGIFMRLFLLVHQALFSLVNLGFGCATVVLLFDSYRRATVPRLRQQLGVIAIGLTACLVLYSLATSIPTLIGVHLSGPWRSGLTIVALTVGSGSIAYSIVRYKFLDTALLARRGILYALASAALVGIYLMGLTRVNRLVATATGLEARVLEPMFLIMALALFQPAIARLEELVDHMMLKDPTDYRNVLRQLGLELQTTIDLEVLLSRSIRTLAAALLPRSAHVVVFTPRGPMARAGAGPPLSERDLARLATALPGLATREPSYRLSDRLEGLSREDQEFLARGLGVTLLVPLRWRGELMGALLLGEKETGTAYTAEDDRLLSALAGQMAVSLQNALLLGDRVAVARFEEELNLARQIQRNALLSEFPKMPRCEVHALYIPSKYVGGDFYDVVPTGDGSYLMAIADVSGKGVPAALLTSMLQAALRTQAESGQRPGEILRNINTLLFRSTAIHQFASFFLARIDCDNLRLAFSNAGHNWPVVFHPTGERVLLQRGGTILGILEDQQFEEDQVTLGSGDLVVLYTDGISEASNRQGEQFGEERLYEFFRALPRGLGARAVTERLLAALHDFLDGIEPQDDVTLLVLRVLEPAALDTGAPPREALAAR